MNLQKTLNTIVLELTENNLDAMAKDLGITMAEKIFPEFHPALQAVKADGLRAIPFGLGNSLADDIDAGPIDRARYDLTHHIGANAKIYGYAVPALAAGLVGGGTALALRKKLLASKGVT